MLELIQVASIFLSFIAIILSMMNKKTIDSLSRRITSLNERIEKQGTEIRGIVQYLKETKINGNSEPDKDYVILIESMIENSLGTMLPNNEDRYEVVYDLAYELARQIKS